MSYLDKKDIFENIEKLKKLEIGSEEFRIFGIKIICSYTKPFTLSNNGITCGSILWDKFIVGDELSRDDLFKLALIGSEAALILDRSNWIKTSANIYKQMFTKYKPEDEYMESLIMDIYLPEGYYKENENFIQVVYDKIDEIMKGRSNIKDLFDNEL